MAHIDLTALLGGQFSALKISDLAKEYASKGMMVFPCHDVSSGACSCGFSECKSSGKHPRVNGWIEQATNDHTMINTWWDLWSEANVGIATGSCSGVWVLDIDIKDGGLEELARIQSEYGQLPETVMQKTGSGGFHYFFTYDSRVNSGVRRLPGIDTRSDGGLVVVAPSSNNSGKYEWVNDFNTPIATAPEWLIDLVKKREEVKEIPNQRAIAFTPLEDDEIENALQFIDSDNRDTWLHVGMGLKAHGISQSVWDRWSSQCADKFSQKSQDTTWKSFKRSDITIATVIDLAKKNGFIPTPHDTGEDYSHIDLSRLLTSLKGEVIPTHKKEPKKDGNVFDSAPGIIGEIARFHEETAPKSQPELAVASALALCSTLCSRKFITGEGNMASLFVLGVGKSTAGKEHGAKTIESILNATNKMHLNGGSWFTSDSACYQSLIKTPRQIVVSDELGITVQAVANDRSGMQTKLRSFLMQVITKLDSSVPPLKYSERGLSEEQKKEGSAVLQYPALSLYGTTTSSTFFESMGMDQVHDGFLGRLLVVESTQERTKMRRNRRKSSDVPQSIKTWVRDIEAKAGNLTTLESGETRPNVTELTFTQESYDLFDKYEDKIIDMQNKLESEGLESVIGRAVEYSMRVSLIAQLAINPSSTAIGHEATQWAIDFVHHCYMTTLNRVRVDVKSSKHEKRMNELLGVIKSVCKTDMYATLTTLSRKTRGYTSSERTQLLESLVQTGEVIIETEASSGGRPIQKIKAR